MGARLPPNGRGHGTWAVGVVPRTTSGTFAATPRQVVRRYRRQHIPIPGPKRTRCCCGYRAIRIVGRLDIGTQPLGTFGCERRQNVEPPSPFSACVPGEFGGELQEPRDSVGSLKRTVRRAFEVIQFTCPFLGISSETTRLSPVSLPSALRDLRNHSFATEAFACSFQSLGNLRSPVTSTIHSRPVLVGQAG